MNTKTKAQALRSVRNSGARSTSAHRYYSTECLLAIWQNPVSYHDAQETARELLYRGAL